MWTIIGLVAEMLTEFPPFWSDSIDPVTQAEMAQKFFQKQLSDSEQGLCGVVVCTYIFDQTFVKIHRFPSRLYGVEWVGVVSRVRPTPVQDIWYLFDALPLFHYQLPLHVAVCLIKRLCLWFLRSADKFFKSRRDVSSCIYAPICSVFIYSEKVFYT